MNKYFFACLVLVAFALPVLAASSEPTAAMKEKITKPITIDTVKDPKREVIFNHSAHAKLDCTYCHHNAKPDGAVYTSCAGVPECHNSMDRKDKSPSGYYFTIHNKESARSCFGCHQKEAAANPDLKKAFAGCNPCHKPAGK